VKLTKNQTAARTLADMYRALDHQYPVTVTYVKADGSTTVRTIEIREIKTTKAGAVILRAADRQSGELRTWRLDRIEAYTTHRTAYTVVLPEAEQPAPVAPRTVAALVAYEIGRDERTTRHLTAAA
jgi:predicted DNA-binding transcriptional regulator YafY